MMMMGQQPQPKGDISQLWELLGVEFTADQVVWQNYNPYHKVRPSPTSSCSSIEMRGQGAVQRQRCHHRRVAAGAVAVPRRVRQAERLGPGVRPWCGRVTRPALFP